MLTHENDMRRVLVYEESSGKSSHDKHMKSVSCEYELILYTYIMPIITQKYRHLDYLQLVQVHHHLYYPPKQVSDLSSSNQVLEMGERH